MNSEIRQRLKDAVGNKIEVNGDESCIWAILGYNEEQDYFYGYAVKPDTLELYARGSGKFDHVVSFSIIESLSEEELDTEGGLTRKLRIEGYCDKRGIVMPMGFSKYGVSSYAIIRNDSDPPRLIAKTWFEKNDVVDYIENAFERDVYKDIDIIDVHNRYRLRYLDSAELEFVEALNLKPDYTPI